MSLKNPAIESTTVARIVSFKAVAGEDVATSTTVLEVDKILLGQSALLVITVISAKGLIGSDRNFLFRKSLSDPYCVVSIDKEQLSARTAVVQKSLSPAWDTQFEIELKFPTPVIVLSIYDQATTQKDPFLGRATIDATGAVSGVTYTGWLHLKHSSKRNAGMVKVSFTLHYTQSSYFLGFIRRRCFSVKSKPADFDVDDLYLSCSMIHKLAVRGVTLPAIMSIVDIFTWQNHYVSVASLFLWYPITYYMNLWPAAFCAIVALYMGSQTGSRTFWKQKRGSNEISTGSMVLQFITSTATANLVPSGLQVVLAGLQDTLRYLALFLMDLFAMVHGKSPYSTYIRKAFWILALVFLIIPFRWVLHVTGFTLLALTSPAAGFVLGVLDFAGYARGKHHTPKLHSSFDFDSLSDQARSMKV